MLNLTKNIYKSLIPQLNASHTLKVGIVHRQKMMFSTFYDNFKNAYYIQKQHRSFGLKFANQGIRMVAYTTFPSVLETSQNKNKTNFIVEGRTVNINFVEQLDQNQKQNMQQKTAWESRKVVSLNLKQSMKLFILGPQKQQNIEISTCFKVEDDQYRTNLLIEYSPEQKEVKFDIQHFKEDIQQEKTHLWNVNFLFGLNQYYSFLQWIRVGLFYSSGASAMIQYDKMKKLSLARIRQLKQYNEKKDTYGKQKQSSKYKPKTVKTRVQK